tara:strand:+ start:5335 stop:6771 length:1437 start_codon:yes stop_codon:yes gene_type:complete
MHETKYMKQFSIFEKISKFIRENNKTDDYVKSFYMDYIENCVISQNQSVNKNKRFLFSYAPNNKSSFFVLKSIIDNKFLTHEQHEYFVKYWGKIQRLYFALHNFVTKIKYMYCNKSITDTDMCLEPLDDLPPSTIIKLIDNNTLYRFRISDLINLINTKLSHAPNFFADPLPITNPYTNGYFNDSHLYNIYFKIKNSSFVMPTLFHMFFLAGFNIDTFLNDNETMLRDYTINKYYRTLDSDQKLKHIKNIIIKYKTMIPSVNTCLRIAPELCRDNLLQHMSPMLNDYLHCTFSLLPSKKFACQERLRKALRRLNRSIIKNEVDIIKRSKPFTNKINGIPTQWGVLRGMNAGDVPFDSFPFVFGQETIEFNQPWHNANNVRRTLINAFNNALEATPYTPTDLQIYNHEDEEDEEDDYLTHDSDGDQIIPTYTDDESYDSTLPADLITSEDVDNRLSQDISGDLVIAGIGFNVGSVRSNL